MLDRAMGAVLSVWVLTKPFDVSGNKKIFHQSFISHFRPREIKAWSRHRISGVLSIRIDYFKIKVNKKLIQTAVRPQEKYG